MRKLSVLLCILILTVSFCSCGNNTTTQDSSDITSQIITDQQASHEPLKLLFYNYEEFAEIRKNEILTYKNMTSKHSSLYNGSAYDLLFDQAVYDSMPVPHIVENSILKLLSFEFSTVDVNKGIAESLGVNYENCITFRYSADIGTVTFYSKLGKFEDLPKEINENTSVDFKIGGYNCYILTDTGSVATILLQPDSNLFGEPNIRCDIATDGQSKAVINDLKENINILPLYEVLYKETGMVSYDFGINRALIEFVKLSLSDVDIRIQYYLSNKQIADLLESHYDIVLPVYPDELLSSNGSNVNKQTLTVNIGYGYDAVVAKLSNNLRFITYKGTPPDYADTKVLGTFEKDGYSCTVYDTEWLDFVMVKGEQVVEGHYITASTDRTVETLKTDLKDIAFMTLSEMLETYCPEYAAMFPWN